nr:sensor histidine kinase [uncultured Bacillus sp.]
MIRTYLKERLRWIMLVLFLQLLFIFISYLDPSIPLDSVIYIVFLSLMAFIIFLLISYQKETKFYKRLAEWDSQMEPPATLNAVSPFEKLAEYSLIEQNKHFKWETSNNFNKIANEKDDLLFWIHEVKTPLTTMQLMLDRIDDVALKSQLKQEWLRIHLLLDQQLHQKRIHFIEHDLFIGRIYLKDLIVTEIKPLQSWCIQKGIGFDLQLEAEDVFSDAKWLAYIIRQLLTNAVKYSDSSDIVIKSWSRNDQTLLAVQDFGRGIDERDLPRIFEKGFTSTTKHHDNKATGMGLYLAKKACEPLLIQIDVQSQSGTGTTVFLTFPKRNDLISITGM